MSQHASLEDFSSHINVSHKFINFLTNKGTYLSMLPMFVMCVELNYSMSLCNAMQFAFNLCVNWFWISLIDVEPFNIMNFITINYHNIRWMFVLCNLLLWEICDFYESVKLWITLSVWFLHGTKVCACVGWKLVMVGDDSSQLFIANIKHALLFVIHVNIVLPSFCFAWFL